MSPRGRARAGGRTSGSFAQVLGMLPMLMFMLMLMLAVAVAEQTEDQDQTESEAQADEGQVEQPTRRQSLKESFFNAETVAVVNLLSSIMLLAVVYLVLGPILDGRVSIIRNDNRRGDNLFDSSYYNWGSWPAAGDAYDTSRAADNAYNTNFADQTTAADAGGVGGTGSAGSFGSAPGQQHYYNDWGWQQSARSVGPASLWRRAAKALQSVDPLSWAWSVVGVNGDDSEVCRQRALCEAASASVSASVSASASASGRAAAVLAPAIKMLGRLSWRFERYSVAMDLGRSGQDCAALFADCHQPTRPRPIQPKK